LPKRRGQVLSRGSPKAGNPEPSPARDPGVSACPDPGLRPRGPGRSAPVLAQGAPRSDRPDLHGRRPPAPRRRRGSADAARSTAAIATMLPRRSGLHDNLSRHLPSVENWRGQGQVLRFGDDPRA